ncbi:pyocin knob domain-containing protein [Pseudomonas nitrititolerans]|uniref:Pyocin knob domain-containing protein n=1 Tax=Stutzerimonas nitrititolerans TaxID=2482751 RepID=A0AA42BFE6_9GAMM|nr:pyocin knob domain-containing protein [Stutzerimonas nitrititolerans]MCO7546189.1 pyocin knob domain-containing protein [Stutzerimonas nitrititolerans]
MPWYNQGTVDVTANSDTVTGTGTAFSANARVGDAFRGPDGRWYEVTNIASATVLSISPAYVGESVSAGPYSIAPMQGYVKESADRLRKVVDEFGAILAEMGTYGPTLKIDAVGLLADRDQYDSASAGFTFYASDSEQLYLKLSSAPGDWSAGAPIARGPAGEKGDTGDVTPEAIAARDTAQAAADSADDSAQAAAASAAAVAAIGAGWTPVIALVPDGERIVMQVDDWTGGESNKPAVGMYVGPSGFVATAAEATNIRPDGGGSVTSVEGVLPDEAGNVDLALGTAAGANVQTSPLDTTPGAILAVGAFGLGAAASTPLKTAAELDSPTTPSGLYRCDDLTSQGLPADVYTVLNQRLNAIASGSQIAIGYSTGRMYQRTQEISWSDWREVWHNGSLPVTAFAKTLLDDADAAAARATLGVPAGVDNQVCTAWVNFNGAGTVEILASHNVSSITDNGTGDYTVNFAQAMINSDYSAISTVSNSVTSAPAESVSSRSTTSVRIRSVNSAGTAIDPDYIGVQIMGGK